MYYVFAVKFIELLLDALTFYTVFSEPPPPFLCTPPVAMAHRSIPRCICTPRTLRVRPGATGGKGVNAAHGVVAVTPIV